MPSTSWNTLGAPLNFSRSTQTTQSSASTMVEDTFGGVAGTELNDHVADSGATWFEDASQNAGVMKLDAGNGIFNEGVGATEYIAGRQVPSDMTILAEAHMLSSMIGANDTIAIQKRSPDFPDRVLWTFAYHNASGSAGRWELYQEVLEGSAETLLVTTSSSRTFGLEFAGENVYATVDGVRIIGPIANSVITIGYAGVRAFNATAGAGQNAKLHLKNFRVIVPPGSISTSTTDTPIWTARSDATGSWSKLT